MSILAPTKRYLFRLSLAVLVPSALSSAASFPNPVSADEGEGKWEGEDDGEGDDEQAEAEEEEDSGDEGSRSDDSGGSPGRTLEVSAEGYDASSASLDEDDSSPSSGAESGDIDKDQDFRFFE